MTTDHPSSPARVVVIGAGITGLSAAVRLADSAAFARGALTVEVWDRSPRPGGLIRSSRFAGIDGVDEGADAYLVRVPHAVQLAEHVGITDTTAPTAARAMVWNGTLQEIPREILLGVPAAIGGLISTPVLTWRAKLRAGLDVVRPRTHPDDSLGALIRARFGAEVHDRLVDALIGSIYATDTDQLSLSAVPQLAQLAASHRSLLIGARAGRRRAATATEQPASGAIFAAPRSGMGELPAAAARYLVDRAVTFRYSTSATTIDRDGDRWRIDDQPVDAVVIATPARSAARLLRSAAPGSAAGLAQIGATDIVMVRIAVDHDPGVDAMVHRHSGYLVPRSRQRRVTAVSFASQKWAHWQPPGGGHLVRASLGRDTSPVADLDDAQAIAAVLDDTERHLGVRLIPRETSITRWNDAFPQYRPGHPGRVASIEAQLPERVALAGASYHGIGIPACIADGERAANQILAWHSRNFVA